MGLPTPTESSTALVTGASSGIGSEIARELASRGHGVTLVARREGRLRELAAEIASAHQVHAEVVAADLGTEGGRDAMEAAVAGLGRDVSVLVNNAGFGDSGPLHRVERERLMAMVRLNCEALLDIQARYSPAMAERGEGAILNVASTAAFQPIPGSATYSASKAFVLNLSEATHSELAGKGVVVTALCPGPVQTEFAEVAGVGWEEKLPGPFWTAVETVARDAVDGLAAGKRVVVPGLLNRAGALTAQHSPRALLLPLLKRGWRASS